MFNYLKSRYRQFKESIADSYDYEYMLLITSKQAQILNKALHNSMTVDYINTLELNDKTEYSDLLGQIETINNIIEKHSK